MMTLAIMSRATLGHTGRPLAASKGTIFAYLCVAGAAIDRFAMAVLPNYFWSLFVIAAGCWILAFAAFVAVYAPMLAGRRTELQDNSSMARVRDQQSEHHRGDGAVHGRMPPGLLVASREAQSAAGDPAARGPPPPAVACVSLSE